MRQVAGRASASEDLLVAMIMRNGEVLVPDGSTVLKENDLLVFAAHSFEDEEHHALEEVVVDRASEAANRPLAAIPPPAPAASS